MSKKGKTLVVGIDFQNDFMLSGAPLEVPGGIEAGEKFAQMIERNGHEIDDLLLSMDSHQTVHIAHTIMYVDKNGNHPDPFTKVPLSDIKDGTLRAFAPVFQPWIEEYNQSLFDNGMYELQLWPEHCKVGTPGHNFHQSVEKSLYEWERKYFARGVIIPKGNNLYVEHYSVFKADVERPKDVTTKENSVIIDTFNEYGGEDDKILLGGLARNFCLFSSIRDFIEKFGEEYAKRFYLLEDCTAAIPGGEFDDKNQEATDYMKSKGVNFINSTDL